MDTVDQDASIAGLTIRLSDADREATAARLRDALADGRLTTDTFQQRLDAAYAAETAADLLPLTGDLPRNSEALPVTDTVTGTDAVPGTDAASRLDQMMPVLWGTFVGVLAVTLLFTGMFDLTRDHPYAWPVWFLTVPFGCVLAAIEIRRRGTRS